MKYLDELSISVFLSCPNRMGYLLSQKKPNVVSRNFDRFSSAKLSTIIENFNF